MKLRTQLALAFLLLAVLPLGGIVLYSHHASEEAFRQAVWEESNSLTGELESRLGSARRMIRDRLATAGEMDAASLQEPDEILERLQKTDLPFVDSLEILPPVPPAAPAPAAPAVPPAASSSHPPPAPPSPPVAGVPPGLDSLIRETISRNLRVIDLRKEAGARQQERTARHEEMRILMGDLSTPIRAEGRDVGTIMPHVRVHALLDRVFSMHLDQGEVLFALDKAGKLVYATPGGKEKLAGVPLSCAAAAVPSSSWAVVTRKDAETGLCLGVARPIRASLVEMRKASVRNFGYGLALVGLCFAGILPLSGRITRNLSSLMNGVERLGAGDLEARVPVRSRDEFGRLGDAFNRMAAELHENQERLLEEERLRKEQEIERRLLEAEHARKSLELEQARQFQLSLLPRELPRRADVELAVHTRTATEVGGDYYDFLEGGDGSLTVAVGDATGHGAAAGTMVTVVKGLFTARAGDLEPAAFLSHANEVIRRMQLGRMAMALSILRIQGRRLTLAAAGMPPLLLRRAATGKVEEVVLKATPLGAVADPGYSESALDLAPGDTLLLMTDGFPELLGAHGELLGYPRAGEIFAAAAGPDPEAVIAHLAAAIDAWRGDAALHDDVTFVALRAA